MERAVTINQEVINRRKPNQNIYSTMLRLIGASREYCVEGEWINSKPTQKPEGNRLVFPNIEDFRVTRDSYLVWSDITSIQTLPPDLPDCAMNRVFQARQSGDPLVLFVPWGVRPTGAFGRTEIAALDLLEGFSTKIRNRKIKTNVLIMPADVYATEVNNQVDPEYVNNYFDTVKKTATQKGFTVKPWSTIRRENNMQYEKLSSGINPFAILPSGILERALRAATRRSGYQDDEGIRKAAFAYLRERLCEAEIVESRYKPIKVSLVTKGRDAYVDKDLPRIYVVPSEFQFPWLQSNE